MNGKVSSATNLGIGEPTSTQITRMGKFAVWSSVLSVLFLSQIAFNIGDFPASTDLFCYALFALYLLRSGYASLNGIALILFLIAAALACVAMALTTSAATWTSLLLLSALYAPFAFRLKSSPELEPVQHYIQSAFVSAATIIAGIAVVQIVAVNVLGISELTNVYFVLPEEIRGAGTYTFLREGGGIVKANGFFLRESADLSVVAALAIILECFTKARWHILAILAAGLLCSFSGSGIVALALGFLMPRSLNRIPQFLIGCVVLFLTLLVLYHLEIPVLDLFFDRLTEFQTPGTSGYARYVAPLDMVQQNLNEGGSAMWLGNGAGSYLRSTSLLRVKYEINDPTWAKLIYEYGLLGFTLILALFVIRTYSSELRPETCNFILFVWMSAGLVLKPYFVLVVWLLTLVQGGYRRRRDPT